MISVGTWKPGAQRFRDSGAGGESGVVKCCRNSVSWLRLSVAMFTPRIMSRVSIYRGIIIIVLLAALASAVRPCFTPTNKGNRNCSGGDNTNNNRSSETQLHAHALRELGEVLVAILGWRPCSVFTLNTNWGQYYNEDFISILGKVEAKCGCWK